MTELDALKYLKSVLVYREGKVYFHSGKEAGYSSQGYWRLSASCNSGRKRIKRSRFIYWLHTGALPAVVDHKDLNTLNDLFDNLRAATKLQNCHNSTKRVGNKSVYKGVTWNKSAGKWQAQITCNYVYHFIGYFDKAEDADKAVKALRLKLHGSFARN